MEAAKVNAISYFLAPHTFAARVDDSIVLLDSRTDDYILIEARLVPGFLSFLSPGAHKDIGAADDLTDLMKTLEERGSISAEPREGKPFELIQRPRHNLEIPGPMIGAIPRVAAHHVVNMLLALLKTVYLLRICGLASALRYAGRLKTGNLSGGPRGDPSDLVEIYNRVRPFFYSAKNRCLFNSLSMIIFLSKYGIVPGWWFGVKLKPFEAHCWVEDEQWLYNDQYARTWRYAPIMRV